MARMVLRKISLTITLPPRLIAEVNEYCKANELSRSSAIQEFIQDGINNAHNKRRNELD